MNQDQKRHQENELIVKGLVGLLGISETDLIQQFADIISSLPASECHQYLQDALNECDHADRVAMYEALRPRLKFKALPLGTYEARIAEKAGAMVTRGHARVEGSTPKPVEVGEPQASAKLRCHACEVIEKFDGATPVDALSKARQAGWVKTPELDEETCPNCKLITQHATHFPSVVSFD